MRRIAAPADRDRGGIAVIVALLMVALLGFAAIAIDVGKLYSERAQLQNGSDSAALMVAQKCAKNLADENCSTAAPLATGLANGNALDGKSNVESISLDKAGRTVTVTTGAKETGSAINTVSGIPKRRSIREDVRALGKPG
jgi:Flp pilus assembly protein TadG